MIIHLDRKLGVQQTKNLYWEISTGFRTRKSLAEQLHRRNRTSGSNGHGAAGKTCYGGRFFYGYADLCAFFYYPQNRLFLVQFQWFITWIDSWIYYTFVEYIKLHCRVRGVYIYVNTAICTYTHPATSANLIHTAIHTRKHPPTQPRPHLTLLLASTPTHPRLHPPPSTQTHTHKETYKYEVASDDDNCSYLILLIWSLSINSTAESKTYIQLSIKLTTHRLILIRCVSSD